MNYCSNTCLNAHTLTAGVFEAVDGVGEKAYTAQEASPLLLVNLLVVPHTDGDGVRLANISEERRERPVTSNVV